MRNEWSREELEASVGAYLEMRRQARSGQTFVKKRFYEALSEKYGRTLKAYEFRMQNISYVIAAQGREWLTGLLPASHVGAKVASTIESILADLERRRPDDDFAFDAEVQDLLLHKSLRRPKGRPTPATSNREMTQFQRDPDVKAWVLREAHGVCESCGKDGPFIGFNGRPYLELHHVRRLADKGSDTPSNAVAVCPNSHRELHFGQGRQDLVEKLYASIPRLVRE